MNLLCIYTKKYFDYPTNKNDTTQHNLALITARKKKCFSKFWDNSEFLDNMSTFWDKTSDFWDNKSKQFEISQMLR